MASESAARCASGYLTPMSDTSPFDSYHTRDTPDVSAFHSAHTFRKISQQKPTSLRHHKVSHAILVSL